MDQTLFTIRTAYDMMWQVVSVGRLGMEELRRDVTWSEAHCNKETVVPLARRAMGYNQRQMTNEKLLKLQARSKWDIPLVGEQGRQIF